MRIMAHGGRLRHTLTYAVLHTHVATSSSLLQCRVYKIIRKDSEPREREILGKGNLSTALCKPQEKTRHTSDIIKPIHPSGRG